MKRENSDPNDNPDLRLKWDYGKAIHDHGAEVANSDPRFARLSFSGQAAASSFRLFARVVDENELEFLCKLRTPNGKPIAWSIVRCFLPEDQATRKRLAKSAARGGWTVEYLVEELKKTRPYNRRGGGRRIEQPQSMDEALKKIDKKWDELSSLIGGCMHSSHFVLRKNDKGPLKAKLVTARDEIKDLIKRCS